VSVRYLQDFRSDINSLQRVLVTVGQKQIPLGDLATIRMNSGPSMLRNENGLLTGYVFIDVTGRDLASYIDDADQVLKNKLALPVGYTIQWSGQYEAMQRVKQRLMIIVPVTFALILFLLWVNTRSAIKTLIVILAVPFSAVGAVWFLYALGYNMSVGVWVGLIALLGVDAETGVFMLLYLDIAYQRAVAEGRMNSVADLRSAIMEGAVKRLRPKFMTVACAFLGLVPIMWSTGTGADVMKRIAAPMIGGILTSFLLELIVYPPIYQMWRGRSLAQQQAAHDVTEAEPELMTT
jgi:Cu(I)/Ag(I) efflux system membrane protein CusA/SilA